MDTYTDFHAFIKAHDGEIFRYWVYRIDYDEWSAREYGEEKVDYYWTAFNLLKAGYRKVT